MQNLIENKSNKYKNEEENGEEKKKRPVIKSATDLQRLKLEKLMKNPDKPIIIPEPPREKDYMQTVPSFVRNVMGSSAGAGSGEFHVYRHLRRKEYARQKCIQAKSMREQLDEEYQSKLEKNRLEGEAKTAKKRAKRLKKKQRAKKPKTERSDEKSNEKEDTSEEEDDAECVDVNSTDKEAVTQVENKEETIDSPAEDVQNKVENKDAEKNDKIETEKDDKETLQIHDENEAKDAVAKNEVKEKEDDTKGSQNCPEMIVTEEVDD